jgi:hypothetical protein
MPRRNKRAGARNRGREIPAIVALLRTDDGLTTVQDGTDGRVTEQDNQPQRQSRITR